MFKKLLCILPVLMAAPVFADCGCQETCTKRTFTCDSCGSCTYADAACEPCDPCACSQPTCQQEIITTVTKTVPVVQTTVEKTCKTC